jgi:hypothetical protein
MKNLIIAVRSAGAGLEDVPSTPVLAVSSNQSDLADAEAVVREALRKRDAPSTLR